MDRQTYHELDLDSLLLEQRVENPVEYIFNDVPMEEILYGRETSAAGLMASADIYLPALGYYNSMKRFSEAGDIDGIIGTASELGESGHPVSAYLCERIANMLRRFIPEHTLPVMEHDLSRLGKLLESMWGMCLEHTLKDLYAGIGMLMSRWCQHHHRHEEARQVLSVLVRHFHKEHDKLSEANSLNDYGLQFILDERWSEAIPLFEQASEICLGIDEEIGYAIARSNYWICRFRCDPVDTLAQNEPELLTLAYTLMKTGDKVWHARKPFSLLARVEENRGNVSGAIEYARLALAADKTVGTHYAQEDEAYLRRPKRKKG